MRYVRRPLVPLPIKTLCRYVHFQDRFISFPPLYRSPCFFPPVFPPSSSPLVPFFHTQVTTYCGISKLWVALSFPLQFVCFRCLLPPGPRPLSGWPSSPPPLPALRFIPTLQLRRAKETPDSVTSPPNGSLNPAFCLLTGHLISLPRTFPFDLCPLI